MAITWDAPLAAAVARELDDRLTGARLRGHRFDWDRRRLDLHFRSGTLRWGLHPEEGWFQLVSPAGEGEDTRPLAAELISVKAPVDERMIRFLFRKIRGRTRRVEVVVELMTNQWNALLLEGSEGWIRHLLWTRRSGERDLAVGQAYHPPRQSSRAGAADPLTAEELDALVRPDGRYAEPGTILERVAFASPVNLPSLLGRRSRDPEFPAPGRPDHSLWLQLREPAPARPCLLQTRTGEQPYPVVLPGFNSREFPSLVDAFQHLAEGSEDDGKVDRTLQRVEDALRRARGRVGGLERELEQAGDPEVFREQANLLLARLGEVEKGRTEIRLKGFKGEEVTLRLDPALSPHENAEALYEEAARQERVLERLPRLLEEARSRVEELQGLKEDLASGETSPGEASSHLPRERRKERWKKEIRDVRLPYRRYRSSGGLEIRVGRGPRDNDALTFRHTHPEDIWMHARGAGGAHVILRWGKADPPPSRDLAEAAVLAALHSGARGAGVVPVDWTWRKYVRKPRKAPPGSVVPSRTTTLFVEPDPTLPERLEPGE